MQAAALLAVRWDLQMQELTSIVLARNSAQLTLVP